MASTPDSGGTQAMPVFYKSVVPLSSETHGGHGLKMRDNLAFAGGANVVPLTVDEFSMAQRTMPILFSVGGKSMPLALMGLQEGRNHFVDDAGKWREGAYVPAYVRRYPFILGKANPDGDELTVCFDDSCPDVADGEGEPLFSDGKPSERLGTVIKFCEDFETAVRRTWRFVEELEKLELLIDGELSIQASDSGKASTYRGFRMVSEDRLKELRGDQVRKMVQNGMLPLIYAHLMSVSLVRELYAVENPAEAAPPLAVN